MGCKRAKVGSLTHAGQPEGAPPPDAAGTAAPGGGSLPCLLSNNSNEHPWNKLKGNHRKSASLLELHVRKAVEVCGIETLGFLTLTFAENITCAKDAQRRLNSLMTRIVRPRYGAAVIVLERTKKKRIHFHLLIPTGKDIRTGVDFEQIADKDYSSAGDALRAEWAFWRKTGPKYGFGRTELLPVKSCESAIARYVSKYISKHIDSREEHDKGVRLVRVSGQFKAGTTRFAWNTDRFRLWRERVKLLCECAGIAQDRVGAAFGPHWAYRHQDIVFAVRIPCYPTEELCMMDTNPFLEYSEQAQRFARELGGLILTPEQALVGIGIREQNRKKERHEKH